MTEQALIAELGGLRAATFVPRPAAISAARAAMHGAIVAGPTTNWPARQRWPRLFGSVATIGVAGLVALGWSAPVGSPLWTVHAAREHVTIGLAGTSRAAAELTFAEALLSDAAAGRNQQASLRVARSILDQTRADLPGDTTSGSWARWRADDAAQRQLMAPPAGAVAPVAPAGVPISGESPGAGSEPHDGSPVAGDAPASERSGDGTDPLASAEAAPEPETYRDHSAPAGGAPPNGEPTDHPLAGGDTPPSAVPGPGGPPPDGEH